MKPSKPSILLITPLPPPVHGSSMVSQWIKDSARLNDEFDMKFINLSTSRKVSEIQQDGVWLNTKKAGRFLVAFIRVLWALCTHHFDLCYLAITCYGKPFLKDLPFVVLCKLFGKRIIIHQHNKGMSRDIDKWPYRWAIPMAYRSTKVILLSEHLYEDVSKAVEKKQLLICPNGIPHDNTEKHHDGNGTEKHHDGNGTEKHHNVNGTPHLLFLSNLIESKGVLDLLGACQILKGRGIDFVCDFIGKESKDISTALFHSRIKALGIDDKVIYHGPKYGEEKSRYWQQASVFVFPTFYKDECFPLVILEAMQHGLSVVTTNEGGIPDIVVDGETGFICERKNVQQLADRIEQLLNHPQLCKEMGHAGRKRYEEHFTSQIFEERLKDCLWDALNQKL